MITVQSNAGELAQQIREFVQETGVDEGELVRQTARLVLKDCVTLTPPIEDLNSINQSFASQRKIGQTAVRRDLNRAFRCIDDLKVLAAPDNPKTAKKLLIAKSKADSVLMADILNKLRYPGVTSSRILDAPDEETHNAMRSRGRVPERVQPYWIMDKPAFTGFLELKLNLVGRLKAGWTAAADALGLALPTWIRMQSKATGSYFDGTTDPARPRFSCVNGTSYAGDVTGLPPERIIDIAFHNRTGAFARQLIAKREGRWNKHNGNRWSTAR